MGREKLNQFNLKPLKRKQFICVLSLFCIRCCIYNKHKSCFGRLSVGNGDLNLYTGFDGDGCDLLHDLGRGVKVDHALVDAHLERKRQKLLKFNNPPSKKPDVNQINLIFFVKVFFLVPSSEETSFLTTFYSLYFSYHYISCWTFCSCTALEAWYGLTLVLHQAWLYTSPVSVCHKWAAMVYHDPYW